MTTHEHNLLSENQVSSFCLHADQLYMSSNTGLVLVVCALCREGNEQQGKLLCSFIFLTTSTSSGASSLPSPPHRTIKKTNNIKTNQNTMNIISYFPPDRFNVLCRASFLKLYPSCYRWFQYETVDAPMSDSNIYHGFKLSSSPFSFEHPVKNKTEGRREVGGTWRESRGVQSGKQREAWAPKNKKNWSLVMPSVPFITSGWDGVLHHHLWECWSKNSSHRESCKPSGHWAGCGCLWDPVDKRG